MLPLYMPVDYFGLFLVARFDDALDQQAGLARHSFMPYDNETDGFQHSHRRVG